MIDAQQFPGALGEIIASRQAFLASLVASGRYESSQLQCAEPDAFRTSLENKPFGVISEIKFASPSAGDIRLARDVENVAKAYADNGAACLSILTEPDWFKGDFSFLKAAKQASGLPVLCKDFVLGKQQILHALEQGADAVLLIVAVLQEQTLPLATLALNHGLSVLVEVHDKPELDIALQADKRCMLGVNNRNLKTMTTDLQATKQLASHIDPARCIISESGIHTQAHIQLLKDWGINKALIGESLMKQANPGLGLQTLLSWY